MSDLKKNKSKTEETKMNDEEVSAQTEKRDC